jgi:hypothetical protein
VENIFRVNDPNSKDILGAFNDNLYFKENEISNVFITNFVRLDINIDILLFKK